MSTLTELRNAFWMPTMRTQRENTVRELERAKEREAVKRRCAFDGQRRAVNALVEEVAGGLNAERPFP